MSYSLYYIIEINYDYQLCMLLYNEIYKIIEIDYTITNFGKRHSDNINININRNEKVIKLSPNLTI